MQKTLGIMMNIAHFKAGYYRQEYHYKSFLPNTINHTFTWDNSHINVLLEDATRALGELNAFTLIVPNVDIFINMHITKEANTSSKIEGTKTQMDDILRTKEQVEPEKRDDWQEVKNYIKAMNEAIDELRNLPLSNRLIKKIHQTLLGSVRGESKMPGEFRKSQNWIGGSSINGAYFIPPNHMEIGALMGDLEKFLNNDTLEIPHLIRIAIAHYQFETIHPFLDGNGRIGRVLITLYLVNSGLLKKPSLYLSDYIEKHKNRYYEKLQNVRDANDLNGWICFFLEAVITTANSGVETFRSILQLKEEMGQVMYGFGKKAHNASKLIEVLYQSPIISINEVASLLEMSKQSANALVKDFETKGILKEITGFRRNKLYSFEKYLNIYSQV